MSVKLDTSYEGKNTAWEHVTTRCRG